MCNGRSLNAWIEHGDQESLALWENDQEEVIELSLADQLNYLITTAFMEPSEHTNHQEVEVKVFGGYALASIVPSL